MADIPTSWKWGKIVDNTIILWAGEAITFGGESILYPFDYGVVMNLTAAFEEAGFRKIADVPPEVDNDHYAKPVSNYYDITGYDENPTGFYGYVRKYTIEEKPVISTYTTEPDYASTEILEFDCTVDSGETTKTVTYTFTKPGSLIINSIDIDDSVSGYITDVRIVGMPEGTTLEAFSTVKINKDDILTMTSTNTVKAVVHCTFIPFSVSIVG